VERSGVCGADSSWPELHAASDPQDDWSEPPRCLHLGSCHVWLVHRGHGVCHMVLVCCVCC